MRLDVVPVEGEGRDGPHIVDGLRLVTVLPGEGRGGDAQGDGHDAEHLGNIFFIFLLLAELNCQAII